MATVTGFTAARMQAIENASVVDGEVVGDNLILTRYDTTTINAGNVRGPQGVQGPTGEVSTAQMNSAILAAIPIGVILDYIETTAPTGWLTMTGQTISNGESLYPELWTKLPATMKSGSNIIFPDTRGKVTIGYNSLDSDFDAVGKTGGSKTHVLTKAQLPIDTLEIDPPSFNALIDPPSSIASIDPPLFNATINPPATTVAINPPSTTIVIDPPSTATTTNSATHSHSYNNQYDPRTVIQGSGTSVVVADYVNVAQTTGSASASHSHTVDIAPFNATVDIASFNVSVDIAPFSNAIDIPAFDATIDLLAFNAAIDIPAFQSSSLGSGEPHNIVQPYVVFLKIIKVV